MKKLISILLISLLCLSICFGLSGCDQPTVSVSSQMKIADSFSGTRTVTVLYPLSADIDAFKDKLISDAPEDVDGASFSYEGVEENGYRFVLTLSFGSKEKYEDIVAALIGRDTTVFLSRKDTYMTHGTRMAEDFDVSELISWMVSDTAASDAAKNLDFSYNSNTVSIGSDTYDTDPTVNINDCTGSAVNSVSIKTSNDKAGSYDRTFTFSIPNSTYTSDKSAIERYFLTNTLPDARYAGWTSEGTSEIYTVIYEDLDLDTMTEVTSKLLDTDSSQIYYGDKTNASTPLSEGLIFEENIDAFSFIGADSSFPKLYYSYSLPLNTTYGDGAVFENGRWVNAGGWDSGVYTVELDDGSARLRIPDGIQYSITGIDFSLESLGDSRFRRSTDFLYAPADTAAVSYAVGYFEGKGVESSVTESDEAVRCRISFEGTTEEITSQLVSVFGSGNFMAYEQHKGMFDLSIKTKLTDYVDLGYMLTADNAAVPMTYTVSSEGGENIVSVEVDGAEKAYTDHSRSSMTIKEGRAIVSYNGNIPVTSSIIIYISVGAVLLALTAFIAIKLLKPRKRRYADPLNNPDEVYDSEEALEDETSDDTASDDSAEKPAKKIPLAQTTTFSIFELNTLVRNKKYVDEINKDVEERMHAQSLEEQKQDIRAKELEEMSRRVYGDDSDSEPAAQNEQDVQPQDGDVGNSPDQGGEDND